MTEAQPKRIFQINSYSTKTTKNFKKETTMQRGNRKQLQQAAQTPNQDCSQRPDNNKKGALCKQQSSLRNITPFKRAKQQLGHSSNSNFLQSETFCLAFEFNQINSVKLMLSYSARLQVDLPLQVTVRRGLHQMCNMNSCIFTKCLTSAMKLAIILASLK